VKINVCSYARVIVEAVERDVCISLNGYVHIYIYIYIFELVTLTPWHCV